MLLKKSKMSTLRPGNTQNVYFPLISHESISYSQLQLATVYDIEGSAILLNENVLMDRSYVFNRFSPSLYLLTGTIKQKF